MEMSIKTFDHPPYYRAPICFCVVRVYSSFWFSTCTQMRAVKLCLGVSSVIEGWTGGKFLTTHHTRSQHCSRIQQKPYCL